MHKKHPLSFRKAGVDLKMNSCLLCAVAISQRLAAAACNECKTNKAQESSGWLRNSSSEGNTVGEASEWTTDSIVIGSLASAILKGGIN